MSERQQSSVPTFLWPGIIVTAISVYGYLNYVSPLESRRPLPSLVPHARVDQPDSILTVDARLWEDPLEIVYERLLSNGASLESATADEQKSEAAADQAAAPRVTARTVILPVLLPGGPSPDAAEKRMRLRYAVSAALTSHHFRPVLTYELRHFRVPLPAIRERSAALRAGSYLLRLAMSAFTGRAFQIAQLAVEVNSDTEYVFVPFERYSLDVVNTNGLDSHKKNESVLVLWIDERQISRDKPLRSIAAIVNTVLPTAGTTLRQRLRDIGDQQPSCSPIPVRIIGPASSDTLLSMAEELADEQRRAQPFDCRAIPGWLPRRDRQTSQWTIFNCRATIDPAVLVPSHMKAIANMARSVAPHSWNSPGLVNVIGTDRVLVETIQQELETRGKLPRKHGGNECVVLVTERDSAYGRAISESFSKQLRKRYGKSYLESSLRVFRYLRGIDGVSSHAKDPEHEQIDDRWERTAVAADSVAGLVPAGRSQVDYLRRLENDLVLLDKTLRRKGGRGILAVGVVGSDIYDKLLVLRALREKLPGVQFFTTDFDAVFEQRSELRFTQNLLVVSHFGLRLEPNLQRDTLPFRDSYQTATYLGTLIALNESTTGVSWNNNRPWQLFGHSYSIGRGGNSCNGTSGSPKPLVYEIGLSGAYQLTIVNGRSRRISPAVDRRASEPLTVHAPGPRDLPLKPPTLLGRIGVSAILVAFACIWWYDGRQAVLAAYRFLGRILGRSPKPLSSSSAGDWPTVLVIALAIALIGSVMWDHASPLGEPWACFAGISIWPSIAIRFVALILAGVVIGNAVSTRWIRGAFAWRNGSRPEGEGMTAERSLVRRAGQLLSEEKLWAFTLNWKPAKSPLSEKEIREGLWRKSRAEARLLRVVALVVLYCAALIAVMLLANDHGFFLNPPSRGTLSLVWSVSTTTLLTGAFLVLVFLVNDSQRLERRLIQHLRQWNPFNSPNPVPASDDSTDHAIQSNPCVRGAKAAVDAIRAIAKETKATGRYQSLAFLVLFLFAASFHRLFDGWAVSFPVAAALAIPCALSVLESLSVRNEAHKMRAALLQELDCQLFQQCDSEDGLTAAQEKALTEAARFIRNEREGALGPLATSYLLQALAIPLGGSSALAIANRFFG